MVTVIKFFHNEYFLTNTVIDVGYIVEVRHIFYSDAECLYELAHFLATWPLLGTCPASAQL